MIKKCCCKNVDSTFNVSLPPFKIQKLVPLSLERMIEELYTKPPLELPFFVRWENWTPALLTTNRTKKSSLLVTNHGSIRRRNRLFS